MFRGNSRVNTVDVGTGLTEPEKKMVLRTWAAVSKDPATLGTTILTCLFERHPEYQMFFRKFHNMPLEELHGNKKFREHAVSVIMGLQKIFDALNDVASLETILVSLGERHGRSGQTPQHFFDLQRVVLDIFRKTLGAEFTSEIENAWFKIFDIAHFYIFRGLQRTVQQ